MVLLAVTHDSISTGMIGDSTGKNLFRRSGASAFRLPDARDEVEGELEVCAEVEAVLVREEERE